MAVFDPSLTADKAASTMPAGILNASGKPNGPDSPSVDNVFQTKGFIDARRKGTAVMAPPEMDMFKERKRVPVHIFNVGPFNHIIPCGSIGTFYIPGCKEGEKYAEMLTPLYELHDEIYPKTRNADAKRLYEEGRKMAVEIIGEGRGQTKSQSKRRVGVFVGSGEIPTDKELHDANAQLHAYCSEQILFMDSMWDRDRKLAYDIYRPETFGACARVLGLTGKEKPWLAQGTPSSKIPCKWCQEPVDPQSPLCHNCKKPVNKEKYLEMMAEEEELQAAVAPSKKGK